MTDIPRQDVVVSYATSQTSPRRVVERYGLSDDPRPTSALIDDQTSLKQRHPSPFNVNPSSDRDRPNSLFVSGSNRPSSSMSGQRNLNGASSPEPPSAAVANQSMYNAQQHVVSGSPPAGPYSNNAIPISPNYRAYAQQPTYVTPPAQHKPINPVFPQPPEEICVECAMRDEEMADVDVTTPGVWERESDAHYEELLQRELEDEANGIVIHPNPSRPKARGDRLSEKHIKVWVAINPREPAARQQTIDKYIRSQGALIEADAVANARALKEARQMDSRMKDTYSQLRRSAYDMGTCASPADDSGGVRIKPPHSPTDPTGPVSAKHHSREITLLENGMIVEHVDVRKEEREAKERRRREDRRARKSSRSSGMEAMSVYSNQSVPHVSDNGVGARPYSRYSPSTARPTSVLTAPMDRLDARTSQASFSDVHSMSSMSPRRRFFGFKNMSGGLLSQDSLAPSGMSGSMVDMHVALQREAQTPHVQLHMPSRRSQLWSPIEVEPEAPAQEPSTHDSLGSKKKKKKGLAKIWRIVTGSSKQGSADTREPQRAQDGNEDDFPLAPPPPLTYLMSRSPGDQRHGSTTSLHSSMSPRNGPSSGSSALPSPSLKPGQEGVDIRRADDEENNDDTVVMPMSAPSYSNVDFDPSHRQQRSSSPTLTPPPPLMQRNSSSSLRMSMEKSLPPIPPGEQPYHAQLRPFPAHNNAQDIRPRTVYTFNPRQLIPQSQSSLDLQPPQAPFRGDVRRQSFNGLSSRPTSGAPVHSATIDGRKSFGLRYDDFGASQRSLGAGQMGMDMGLGSAGQPMVTNGRAGGVPLDHQRLAIPAPAKRRSFFGLSTIFGSGKKNQQENNNHIISQAGYDSYVQTNFPNLSPTQSPPDDGRESSTKHGEAMSIGNTNRSSVHSRRALAELVAQDAEFVAYRYPSNDQRLDLLR